MQLFSQFGCLRNSFIARQLATFLATGLTFDEHTSSKGYLADIVKRYSKCFRTLQCQKKKKNFATVREELLEESTRKVTHYNIAFTGHAPSERVVFALDASWTFLKQRKTKKLIG